MVMCAVYTSAPVSCVFYIGHCTAGERKAICWIHRYCQYVWALRPSGLEG